MKRNDMEKHECREITCGNCFKTYMSNQQHLCYMRSCSSDLNPDKFSSMTLSVPKKVESMNQILW